MGRSRTAGSAAVATLVLGTLMAAIDVSIANIAGPSIMRDLPANPTQLELVLCAYNVAYAALLILGARLGGRWGQRRYFLLGVLIFTAASAACGFAPNVVVLVTMRAVQGVGAAFMVPQVFAMIQVAVPPTRRAAAMGLNAAAVAAGSLVGQFVGGMLITANLADTGWRAVFLINIPVGLLLFVAGARFLPDTPRTPGEIDVPGTALLGAVIASLVVVLIFGPSHRWPWWSLVTAGINGVLGGALLLWVTGGARAGRPRVIDVTLMRRPFTLRLIVVLTTMIAYGGFLITFTTYEQLERDAPPAIVGLVFGIYAAGFAAASIVARRFAAMLVPSVALAVMTVGHLALTSAPRVAVVSPVTGVLLLLAGTGYGMAFTKTVTHALGALDAAQVPQASGLLNVTVQVGYLIGVATIGDYYLTHRTIGGAFETTGAAIAAVVAAGCVLSLVTARAKFTSG